MTNEMATSEEILKFMRKDISGKFDSLKEVVEGLKSSSTPVEKAGVASSTSTGTTKKEIATMEPSQQGGNYQNKNM